MRMKMRLIEKSEIEAWSSTGGTTGKGGTVSGIRVQFTAVNHEDHGPDDALYNGATPQGNLSFTVVNPLAVEELKKLKIGDKTYVDLAWPA